MKSKYFLILILILAGVLQGIRFLNKGDYFSLEQKHLFNLPKNLNGDIELKDYQKYLVFYSPESELSQKFWEI